MFGPGNFLTILLLALGWCLITMAVRDIFITVQMAITKVRKQNGKSFYYYSLSFVVIIHALQLMNSHKRWRFILSRANILFPLLQILFWKLLLIAGFAFVYLGIEWQLQNSPSTDDIVKDFLSALWISFEVSVRLAPYNITSDEMLFHLIVNIQFYSVFLFYGISFLYLLISRQKATQLQPRLYGIEYELKKQYSPFHFYTNLKHPYSSGEIIVILEKWEVWAERLRDNLTSFPPLIYTRPRPENRSWLSSLNIILDTTAAIIVTSDEALVQKARRTLAVFRHNLIEIEKHVCVLPSAAKQVPSKELYLDYEDNVLSAEVIFDMKEEREYSIEVNLMEENNPTTEEIEMLEVWQFTYQTALLALSDYLAVELPSCKTNKK